MFRSHLECLFSMTLLPEPEREPEPEYEYEAASTDTDVGPDRYCPPRHSPHSSPSCILLVKRHRVMWLASMFICQAQSVKISHIDMGDDRIDMVDNHNDNPCPKSITHIPYRHPYRYLIDVRSPISISHIDLPYRSPDHILSLRSGPRPRASMSPRQGGH